MSISIVIRISLCLLSLFYYESTLACGGAPPDFEDSDSQSTQDSTQLTIPRKARPAPQLNTQDFKKTLVSGWNAISPTYLEHKLHDLHPGDLVESPVLKGLVEKYGKDAEFVLDAATGNGWFAQSALKWKALPQLKKLIGVDISSAMINTARTQISDPRVEFACGSLESDVYDTVGITKNSLDLVISSNALDCVENIEATLTKLHLLLKANKFAVIPIRHPERNSYYLTGKTHSNFQEGPYLERWQGTGSYEVIRFYRHEKSWDYLFESNGFEIIEKIIPQISDDIEKEHPEHYRHYRNKKHPGALIYVLRT